MRTIILSILASLIVLVTSAAAQRTVNTRQLGLIRVGMSAYEVHQRLGPPTEIQYGSVLASQPRANLLLQGGKAVWFYRGNGQVSPAQIIFVGGRVQIARRLGERPR